MKFLMSLKENPSFPAGIAAFYKYISKAIKYPSQARRMGIEGRVYIQFVVSKTGELTDIKMLRGIGAGCGRRSHKGSRRVASVEPRQAKRVAR